MGAASLARLRGSVLRRQDRLRRWSASYRPGMTSSRDERIARLYGLPLEQFTPERNALAAAFRVEGDAEGAALGKALRKPPAAAGALNQLVRAEPDLVEALLGAGGELRQAHRQAASGRGAEQLRAAAGSERAAVRRPMGRAPAGVGPLPRAGPGGAAPDKPPSPPPRGGARAAPPPRA